MARRLNDKHVFAAYIFVNFNKNLVVGKAPDARIGQRQAKMVCNALGKWKVRIASHQFHACKSPMYRATDSLPSNPAAAN